MAWRHMPGTEYDKLPRPRSIQQTGYGRLLQSAGRLRLRLWANARLCPGSELMLAGLSPDSNVLSAAELNTNMQHVAEVLGRHGAGRS